MKLSQSPLRLIAKQTLALAALATAVSGCSAHAKSFEVHDPQSPLRLVRSIQLPDVKGRIDHLAFDADRMHLLIAEYGNGTVDDIDLTSGKVVGRISGLHEPQSVAWLPVQHEIVVASGDGLLTFYRGSDRQEVGRVQLGDDADDVRIDDRNGNLVVGYGSGALAVIDPAAHKVLRRLALPGHPEGFVLIGSKVVVNVPNAREVITADIDRNVVTERHGTAPLFSNFAMGADARAGNVAVSYRFPSMLRAMDARSGAPIFTVSTCGDVDDLYYRSDRVVIVCGSGAVELVDARDGQNAVEVSTRRGARTGIFVPKLDRLFVALPSADGKAVVWELSFSGS